MKTYSGTFKPKNKSKYKGNVDDIVYRSGWEKNVFIWCDKNNEVKYWSSEEIIVPYLYEVDKRTHRYFPDVFIEFKNGTKLLVEIKPEKQTKPPSHNGRKTKRYLNEAMTYVKNINKWHSAEQYAKKKGWKFEIWTEKTLEKMGILPKKPKPLPKLKSMSGYRRRRGNTRKKT